MTTKERVLKEVESIELREFPADVQDLLRDRAIERGVSIETVILDYVCEKSEQIIEATRGVVSAA